MSKLSKHYADIKCKNIISIQVNLLNKCTSKCKYCRKYTWPNDVLDLKTLKNAIDYLHTNHALKSITFSGGDPILYPYIVEILQYCKTLNISTSLITTLITEDITLLTNIAKLATRIHVSVDGATPTLYLKTRGVDKFDIVKKNVQFVNALRADNCAKPIRISSTISNINQDTICELFEFAMTTGSTINYYFIHRYDKYNPDSVKLLDALNIIKRIDIKHISNVDAILLKQFTNDASLIKSKECNIPYIHCLINANGDIYPCCKLLNDNGEYGEQLQYVYGNLYTDALDKIFDKSVNKTKRICEDCAGCEERYIPLIDEVNEIINGEGDVAFL